MIGQLPRSIELNGQDFPIDADFRNILTILEAFADPDLEPAEKAAVCLIRLYGNLEDLPDLEAAYKAAVAFIDAGNEGKEETPKPQVMDWVQDERLLFPAVNKVAGFETRTADFLHWWTFLGYFMEISDGVYSQVLTLRSKKARHKKLEDWERQWWAENKDICVIKPRITTEEQTTKDWLNSLLE